VEDLELSFHRCLDPVKAIHMNILVVDPFLWIMKVLAKDGICVRGISRKGTPRADAKFTDYLSADPTNPNEEVCSMVLVCILVMILTRLVMIIRFDVAGT
jgi:hypothetical protein